MSILHPTRPPCWDECAELVRSTAARTGVEVSVMVAPDMIVIGAYPPFVATCPHGVTYMSEPTGEQIAEWVETRTP